MNFLRTLILVALVALPLVMVHKASFAYAEDEVVEDMNTEDSNIETEDEELQTDEDLTGEAASTDEEEEEDEDLLKKSPDADTKVLFIKPVDSKNLPAGSVVQFIVGFTNNGPSEFLVESMEASFRYPQDFNYFIQNFTTFKFGKTIEPGRQGSFEYTFMPSENFNGRPFGLTVNLNYVDAEGKLFQDAVFNETVTIEDPEEGFEAETFFMWLTIVALVVLIGVALQQTVFAGASRRWMGKSKQKAERGTTKNGDVDLDWIPKETLKLHDALKQKKKRKGGHSSGASSGASSGEETN